MFPQGGSYVARVSLGTPERLLQDAPGAVSFELEELTINTHHRGYRRERAGLVIGPGDWTTERAGERI